MPEATEIPPEEAQVEEPSTYTAAIEAYLGEADWLTLADAPLKVHARAIAASLDKQVAGNGQIVPALASSFDKVIQRLDARRPPATPKPPSLGDTGPFGEQSIFEVMGT